MNLIEKPLQELAKMVFSEKYEFIDKQQKLKGKSGKIWTFDAIVNNKEFGKYGVFIRDWKREISITQLRQLHRACIDTNIDGGIMICNIISDFSKDYANQFGLSILSKGHLISKLRNRQFQF
ncbi:MAG: hypothetical protein ACTSQJ_03260 [Promethearchaeota archaeon]